jgi:beta-lactamase superfamily II metal-dependent hydrolase
MSLARRRPPLTGLLIVFRPALFRLLPFLAALVALSGRAQAAPPLRIAFITVGQGDAALITSPTGKTVLIDGGPRDAGPALVARLRAQRSRPLDLVLLTHRHADHLGGLAEVVRNLGARLYMDAPFPHPSPAYAELMRTLAAQSIPVRGAERGRRIDIGGGAWLTLLSPPEPSLTGTRSDVNANSVIVRLDYGETSALFAADAEAATERWLLQSGAKLSASVLKVAHHGSHYSSGAAFLHAVSPAIAIVSVGASNDYGHPAPDALARLAKRGARVFRTDRDGTITVELDGTHVKAQGEHEPTAWVAR